MADKKKIHPGVFELKGEMEKGKISRREFIRMSALLGAGAAAAFAIGKPATLLARGKQEEPEPQPGKETTAKETSSAPKSKRGGTVRAACSVMKVGHPAQLAWNAQDLFYMQIMSYMAITGPDGITRPYLCRNWEVSEDVKTWTFNLREDVTFNNGDKFVADDFIFTLNEWLNPDVGSAMLGLMGGYLDPTGIEKVNDHQVVLHLKRGEIAVPEHLYQYPAFILNHRTFEGDFLKAPHGTGAFTLDLYREGELARMKRREDFWMMGEDGSPLPYVDGIEFIDMGAEYAAQVAAAKGGEIDLLHLSDGAPAATMFQECKDDPNLTVDSFPTSRVKVLRMRSDIEPFNDNRVRTALKLCQQREKIMQLAYYGEGVLGHDTHTSPIHPEYCEKPIPPYDPERAKQLLKEAGYPNGLAVDLSVPAEQSDAVRNAEVLKEDAIPAGFQINLDTMPASKYWEQWTEVPLGLTQWGHRALGTMVFGLGYIGDADGNPVPWNETRWVDPEFDKLYAEASATYDVNERRKIMCKLEQIQMDRGSIGVPYFSNFWSIYSSKYHDVPHSPQGVWHLEETWFDA